MSIANIKSSLHSDGRLQANLFDELSDSSRNVGIDSIGTFHCNDITEGSATGLASTVPMRITDNKELLVYDQIDQMNPVGNIMGNLIDLAQNGFTGLSTPITSSNLGNVQEIIENADPHFNVFAVVSYNECAEDLTGIGTPGGRTTFTGPGFVFNTSSDTPTVRILSTGYDIKPMSGAAANTERVKHDSWDYVSSYYKLTQKIDLGRLLDGKRWMGMAVFDGYTDTTNIPKGFRGIALWIFEDQTRSSTSPTSSISYNPEDYLTSTPTDPVVKVRDIFYPAGSTSSLHVVQTLELERDSSGISFPKLSHQFLASGDTADYSTGIGPSTIPTGTQDTISASGQTNPGANRPGTKTSWRFSVNNTSASDKGYAGANSFSNNNGVWGYNLGEPATTSTGLDFDYVAFGNFNGSDGASAAMRAKWKGQNISGTDWVCFIFSGDALPS